MVVAINYVEPKESVFIRHKKASHKEENAL